MPELPEIETIKKQLERKIKGEEIKSVDIRLPKLVKYPADKFKRLVRGAKITGLKRRGKILLVSLSKGPELAFHMKMSGQLIYNGEEGKHTHIVYHFEGGDRLVHNDLRQFGYVKVIPEGGEEEFIKKQKLGIEPFDSKFNLKYFTDILKRKKKSKIKIILMDQSLVSGIGNIYASEILFASRIHPTRLAGTLKPAEVKRLYKNIGSILKLAIEKKGSSDRDYVDAFGRKGKYMDIAKVYQREGQPCYKCKSKIKRIKFGGRSAYFCPKCQK